MFRPPVAASGSREPARARPLPRRIRDALAAMVRGLPPDYLPVDFITAGKAHGVPPDAMRRWLHRNESVAYLRAERRRFRTEICCANEYHLSRIRGGPNAAAATRAISILEDLDDGDALRSRREQVSPGITIVIETPAGPRPVAPVSPIIEHEPQRERHNDREPSDAA